MIQKHDASRLHYDFRLELDGVLKSWAVPKGPSLDPARKSLAVQVEDHPIEYGSFEGIIPEGEYGGGTVLLWDTGTWEPLHDPNDGMKTGHLHFVMHGQKLQGEWTLVQMHSKPGYEGKDWLLMKVKDKFASSSRDILKEAQSVKTDRSMEQIAEQHDKVWSSKEKKETTAKKRGHAAMPSFSPQLAVLAEHAPSGDEWLHEIKYDGYRMLARVQAGKVRLITRNGKDWTAKFPTIAKTLAGLKVESAIVDGEIVVLDAEGRSDFGALQAMIKEKQAIEPAYFAFDLPYCDAVDLRETPLVDRKKRLEELLKRSKLSPRVNLSEHIEGEGSAVIEKACSMSLEGIVSKRADSPYVSKRDSSWLKSKCGQRQEFVVIGYTDPQGARSGFGSLLLGYHDDKKHLLYAGRVGTGFDQKLLKQTTAELKQLEQDEPATDEPPPARERAHAHWVKPQLVAEVTFSGWTRDGSLRHPAFVAFRSDKPAAQIVREKAVAPQAANRGRKTTAETKTSAKPAPTEVAEVKLTHPDKILFTESKVTKQQLADYYHAVAEWMLPVVVDRPLALLRCPEGESKECFFQRKWSNTLSKSIGKIDVGEGAKHEFHVTVHDLSGIIAMAQVGVLEIHTWNCRNDNVERPDQLVFDLDPAPDVPWKRVIDATRKVDQTLRDLGLPTFLKTSGGKGLHLTVPIVPNIDWETAKSFCSEIAKSLSDGSDMFVANMRKDLRKGKVYIDYNRNGRTATAIAPYSTRARGGAPIAMPIEWEELGRLKSAADFTVKTSAKHLAKRKSDPWAEFEKARVDLMKVIGKEK